MRLLLLLLSVFSLASAQFGGFFDQMFNGQGGQEHHQQRNNPSDANHYRSQFEQCKKSPPLKCRVKSAGEKLIAGRATQC